MAQGVSSVGRQPALRQTRTFQQRNLPNIQNETKDLGQQIQNIKNSVKMLRSITQKGERFDRFA